jgi:hypothetical protein
MAEDLSRLLLQAAVTNVMSERSETHGTAPRPPPSSKVKFRTIPGQDRLLVEDFLRAHGGSSCFGFMLSF